MKAKVDLSEVLAALDHAITECVKLDGVEWADPGSWRNNTGSVSVREHKARVSRELLHLEHILDSAKQQVGKVYWEGKGFA